MRRSEFSFFFFDLVVWGLDLVYFAALDLEVMGLGLVGSCLWVATYVPPFGNCPLPILIHSPLL